MHVIIDLNLIPMQTALYLFNTGLQDKKVLQSHWWDRKTQSNELSKVQKNKTTPCRNISDLYSNWEMFLFCCIRKTRWLSTFLILCIITGLFWLHADAAGNYCLQSYCMLSVPKVTNNLGKNAGFCILFFCVKYNEKWLKR